MADLINYNQKEFLLQMQQDNNIKKQRPTSTIAIDPATINDEDALFCVCLGEKVDTEGNTAKERCRLHKLAPGNLSSHY
jgi:hypothetical protein